MSLIKINEKQRIIESLIMYQCWNWLKNVATVSSYLIEEANILLEKAKKAYAQARVLEYQFDCLQMQ